MISYPLVVLTKSAKIIAVLLVGAMRGVYKLDAKKLVMAVFITLGLMIFNSDKIIQHLFKQ